MLARTPWKTATAIWWLGADTTDPRSGQGRIKLVSARSLAPTRTPLFLAAPLSPAAARRFPVSAPVPTPHEVSFLPRIRKLGKLRHGQRGRASHIDRHGRFDDMSGEFAICRARPW